MGREHEPVKGQWYENLEDGDLFQVLSFDEDSELVAVQYEDGDLEEVDYETWQEMDLELADEPEGWIGGDEEDDEEVEEEDEDEEDDDWDDEDEDEDDDDWDDEDEDDHYGDRDDY
ncbi:MAG: DUF6763 family protein [Steroidobacteraceae bacterium]|jgi:hypothetical protein